VSGRAQYGCDVRIDGLLFASIERSPVMGATLESFDATRALAVPGVRHVVGVKSGIHPGVAVVAVDSWTAQRARAELSIKWGSSPHQTFNSAQYLASLPSALEAPGFKVRHEGDALTALATAARRHEATYEFPFEAHAPMETMNCTARVTESSAEVWVPTQTDVRTIAQICRVTGLPESAVTVHCMMMGGGFGRRLFADFVAEAVDVARAVRQPVQVLWTREDDMRCGYFQPATIKRFSA